MKSSNNTKIICTGLFKPKEGILSDDFYQIITEDRRTFFKLRDEYLRLNPDMELFFFEIEKIVTQKWVKSMPTDEEIKGVKL